MAGSGVRIANCFGSNKAFHQRNADFEALIALASLMIRSGAMRSVIPVVAGPRLSPGRAERHGLNAIARASGPLDAALSRANCQADGRGSFTDSSKLIRNRRVLFAGRKGDYRLLVRAECGDGVDLCSAAGGDPAGGRGGEDEECRGGGEGQPVPFGKVRDGSAEGPCSGP